MIAVARTTRAALSASTVLFIAGACSVAPLQGAHYVGPQNVCTDTCADGAACSDGACRAQAVSYGLLLDVTPPSTAHYAGGTTFRFGPYSNPSAGQLNETLSLARVSIRLDAATVTELSDKPIALSVSLVEHADDSAPVPQAILRRYEFESDTAELATLPKHTGHVAFEVPSGSYDVYIAPRDADVLAVLPPILQTSQSLTSGELRFVVGALSTFSLKLTDVDATDLRSINDGWDVKVVDRVTGRTLSTVDTTCDHPATAKLRLTPGLTQHTYSVRFSPPATPCPFATTELRPNYDFDLDALNIGGAGNGTAVLPSMTSVHAAKSDAPIAVNFSGWVVPTGTTPTPEGGEPDNGLPATVLLHSDKISLPSEWRTGSAWYATKTGSSAGTAALKAGSVSGVQVIAGVYDIQLLPELSVDAAKFGVTTITKQDLTQSSDTNRTFFWANPKTLTLGRVVGSDGTLFGIANVDFVPETPPAFASDPFAEATRAESVSLSVEDVVPTTDCHDATSVTKHAYNFNAFLDQGSFDLVVRTPPSSGFPWIVLQQIEVSTPSACSPLLDLATTVAVAPTQFSGTIVDENGDPVAFANVQARAIVASADGKTLASAPVVAEGHADEKGNYTLLVPSKLDTFQTSPTTK